MVDPDRFSFDDGDDDDDEIDYIPPLQLSLKGALAWIGTRNGEFVQTVLENWSIDSDQVNFDGSNFSRAPTIDAAWTLLRRLL